MSARVWEYRVQDDQRIMFDQFEATRRAVELGPINNDRRAVYVRPMGGGQWGWNSGPFVWDAEARATQRQYANGSGTEG